jgi:hypothetical protein
MTLSTTEKDGIVYGAAAMLKTINMNSNGYSWEWIYNIANIFIDYEDDIELKPLYGLYFTFINTYQTNHSGTFVKIEKLPHRGFAIKVLLIAILFLGSIVMLVVYSNSKYVPRVPPPK